MMAAAEGGRIDAVLAMLERFSSQFEEDVSRMVQSPSGGASVAPAPTVSTTDIPAGRG